MYKNNNMYSINNKEKICVGIKIMKLIIKDKNKLIKGILISVLVIILIATIITSAIIGIRLILEYIKEKDDRKINETSSFPTEVYGIPVHTQLIEEGTIARPGTKRKIKYIVIHETDNFANGAAAENHAEYLSNNNTETKSWHYTVDDKEIYHHIPDNEIAYHAGDRIGNNNGVGVELCVNEDGDFDKTFDNATKLVAYLLKEYDLKLKDIKTHNNFSGKDCPHSILKDNRMEEFVEKVEVILKEDK